MHGHKIVLAEKDIQFSEFEPVAWPCKFGLIEHNEIIAGILFDLWTLVWILAILNREVMEAELFRELFKIPACGIGHISPNNIALDLA